MNNLNRFVLNSLNLNIYDIEDIKSTKNNENYNVVNVTLKRIKCYCVFCDANCIVSNGFFSKKIINSSDLFSNTIINLKIPRFYCKNCGKSFSTTHYIHPKSSKFSYRIITSVMELLKQPNFTFSSVSKLLSISESSVVRIFDKYTHIPRLTFPEAICIDEVYTKVNSFDSKYSCVFYDFITHKLIDITPSRRKDFLHSYFQCIPKSELDNVKYVCIDMYVPYKQISQMYFKKAVICIDSFHVIKNLNDSFSNLRVKIMKSYPSNSYEYYLLKNFKFLLLNRNINLDNEGKYNHKLKKVINYRQILNMTLSIDNSLRLAYELKELYTSFNMSCRYENACNDLESIIEAFTLANIEEFNDFLNSLINWKQEIINSFIIYKNRRINNSVAESQNNTIASLIYNTRGIRNHERRRKRIMYVINKSGFVL